MAAVCFCGDWLVSSCDKKLVAVHTKDSREPFVFDCSAAEKKPKDAKTEDTSSDGGTGADETGSDKILDLAVSASGKLAALTDDTKRLVLFRCDPSWSCVSIRWVVRRCTALAFSRAEDELLAADKSGDVYSFSVKEPQKEGELKLGHLSMLLALTLTPDDKYIITADRDEKIRVSRLSSPHNIQAFCLGHTEFVSALLIPSAQPGWLLSGSGDGTVKLWEYESGRRLQSLDLHQLHETPSSEEDQHKKAAVCRISCSPDGRHVAVQCERVPAVQFFSLDLEEEEKLAPLSRLMLPHCPLDLAFDPQGRLWVLMESRDAPLQIYTQRGGGWECDAESPECSRVAEAFKPHWGTLEACDGAESRYEHLYKVDFDNMAAYMQKKQQRLEQQQQQQQHKKKRTTRSAGQEANKKTKTEAETRS
ncbi:tRNA (guanine-N(7)-)-methyltransferase non-catalytic subunit wdr4 [Genypterus blacodes]|uniref:tRNA (guanine-N(7)-)-methyltransferase non-catalytic subunit wdr4 n=1 Tax=Genypterus blacodes TaxID=154954 RepID=UPI003F776672